MKYFSFSARILYLALCALIVVAIAGCTSSNSLSSLNPTAADTDTEAAITRGDGTNTASNTSTITLAPVVNIYTARNTVGPQAEVDLRAEAIDPAGGQVNIAWESPTGTFISTSGSNATWKAPLESSKNTITCIATDVRGKSTRAEVSIEVIGNAVYRLVINADRTSLVTSRLSADAGALFVPVAGARVEIAGFGSSGVTDASGMVEFNLDQGESVASSAQISVSYYDWEAAFVASLAAPEGTRIVDNLTFYPGYDSVSVAVARGDSFLLKRGMIEVTALENSAGVITPVAEVTIDAGSKQAVSAQADGRALVSSASAGNSDVSLRLSRVGYQTIEGYAVPVAIDGVTLVRARLARTGSIADLQAIISYVRPFNGQTAFPIAGPFVIGFGQAMEKGSIFDNVQLMIENKKTGSLVSITGPEIQRRFKVEWEGNTVLKLYPLSKLRPDARYSLLISKWEAHAADSRLLKSYAGMYGEFTTDVDPSPSVLSTSPTNGATGIGRSGPFTITFDRSMKPESLTSNLEIEITSLESGSRLVIKGSDLKSHFAVTWKNNNRLLELVPYRMLRANASYLIRLNKCSLVSETGRAINDFARLWGQFSTSGL
ncbi:MAG TPA: Ig-like domain-containing protein [Candidatus Rifleibacterium sp.]|nr:Ig-like domain-containing protein [Candidatus Rifleibacterium sp.]HPT47742.1 Ig-like domain-containing protein [Candidatus Rifleibacterium sp.]